MPDRFLPGEKIISSPPLAVAFGSSTGGPNALAEVFAAFKNHRLAAPIFVIQHMPTEFMEMLAERLARVSGMECKVADDGDVPEPGCIYLARGDMHMLVKQDGAEVHIELDPGPKVHFCRPAVDPSFVSLAKVYGSRLLAGLLTGMGQDGAEGAQIIRNKGGRVVIQDKDSSAVWGMPGAAYAAGAYDVVMPLKHIGRAVANAFGKTTG